MKLGSILLTSTILAVGAWFWACSPSGDTANHEEGAGEDGGSVLPFITDDYNAALATARKNDLPIFVDTWAPW